MEKTSLIVLGTVQDAGSPHIGCNKECCKDLFENPDLSRKVVSLGIIDEDNKKKYLFEATPDITFQIRNLFNKSFLKTNEIPDGIFLTHAHIGHYTGLIYLGKEAMNSDKVDVYVMPRMKMFLENNAPWNQLVKDKNIVLQSLGKNQQVLLTSNIKIKPLIVPHRDEYSETIGYIIEGHSKKAVFVPDADRWEKWETDIIEVIANVDYAFIDGTFYSEDEINNRSTKEIPHPFITESLNLFKVLSSEEKRKIYFIHFNHTNPVLDINSKQTKTVIENGFNIARMNQAFKL
jgi:pyrroloquinoline quinone biosynthesis protein B